MTQPLHSIKTYATEKGVPICLHENKFFRMMFNGYFHYLDAVKYARGAVVVPRFANGDVLLVRLRRAPAIGMSLEFPRGGLEPDEAADVGACRELREESGYDVPAGNAVLVGSVAPDTATINGINPVFMVTIPDDAVQGAFDVEEIDLPMRVSERAFRAMICAGEIVDGMTLAAWTLVQEHISAKD